MFIVARPMDYDEATDTLQPSPVLPLPQAKINDEQYFPLFTTEAKAIEFMTTANIKGKPVRCDAERLIDVLETTSQKQVIVDPKVGIKIKIGYTAASLIEHLRQRIGEAN
jgi:hypothetical protein